MDLLDIVMLLGVAYVSWKAGKSVGASIYQMVYEDVPSDLPIKEQILIEKIDSVYFAYRQNRFVTQDPNLAVCIAEAMGDNPNITLVAENKTVEQEIVDLLTSVRKELDARAKYETN